MKALLTLAVLAIAAGPAFAEDLGPAQRDAAQRAATPDLDTRTGLGGSGFVVTADGGASAVAIGVSRNWDAGGADLSFHNLSLKASAPFDKSAQEGNFLTDGGLAGSTSVELDYTHVFAPGGPLPSTLARRTELRERGRRLCAGLAVTEDAKKACAKATANDVLAYLSPAEQADLEDRRFLQGRAWLWGGTVGVGHDEFSWRDPADFGDRSGSRTPFSLSLHGGTIPIRQALYLGGGVEYKRAYKAAKTRTLCPPVASGPLECVAGPFAGPKRDKTFDVFAVGRLQSQVGAGDLAIPFGLEVKSAYDFETEVVGVTTALYLVSDDKKALRGGVRLRWQSDDDDPATKDDNFAVGVFVGAAFSVF